MSEIKVSLPSLHEQASGLADQMQRKYFNCIKAYFCLIVIASVISYFVPNNQVANIFIAMVLIISLFLFFYMRTVRPQDVWYNARAVAESVKTRAWRWMMHAEPYLLDNDKLKSESSFISDLKEILEQNPKVAEALEAVQGEPISDSMRKIRDFSCKERLAIYKKQRIEDQLKWYENKSKFNKKMARFWFGTAVVLHLIILILVLYGIYDPLTDLPTELVATLIGAVFTWTQSKKHIELVSAYSLTAQEINFVLAEACHIKDAENLSEYVNNSENAFSREHTQWFARKIN